MPVADPQAEPTRRALVTEVERLRKRVRQQQHSLGVLTDALSTLQSGGQALRDENRELREELRKLRRSSAAPVGALP